LADFDLSRYVNPGNPVPNIDITGAYRQWMNQHLQERQQQAQEQQFAQNQQRQTSEFNQEQEYKNRVSNDINARFGLELGEKTNARQYERNSQDFEKQRALLAAVRKAAAEGRWNEVEASLGTLKELGADVGRTFDAQGKPIYHLQGGNAPSVTGETFDSALGHINQNRSGTNYQFDPNQPQIVQPGRSPFDTSLGTVSHLASPDVSKNPQLDATQQQQNLQPISQTQNPNHLDNQPQEQPQQATTSHFDPYEINSSQLQRMNEIRLQPLMAGIEGAFPNRFQPQIASLLGGISALGASPEGYLEHLQKPMDTAARLMGAELNAEGNMAKAGIQAGGQANSEARMRENEAYKRAEQAAKDYGVRQAVDNSVEMKQIHEQLMSNDPNANADGVKALLSMREGNRLTDKDFDIGVSGYASNWDMAKQQLTRVYHTGLTDDQKSNFNQLIGMFLKGNQRRIQAGSKKLIQYMNTFRNEPERYGVYNYIRGRIPDEYITPELLNADPSKDFGGRTPGTTSKSKSVSVTAPTTQQAVQGVKDINSEADEILGQ